MVKNKNLNEEFRDLLLINQKDVGLYLLTIKNSFSSSAVKLKIDLNQNNQIVLEWKFLNYYHLKRTYFTLKRLDLQDEKTMLYMFDLLKTMAEISFEKIPFLETQQGFEINLKTWPKQLPEEFEGIFHSLISYTWYDKKDKINKVEMAIDLLISIARGHHLPNGNKRMAVLMLTTFLDYFGIYIFQSYSKKDRIKYVKTWELIMCEIVDKRRYIQNKLGELVPTTEILTDKEIITNILMMVI